MNVKGKGIVVKKIYLRPWVLSLAQEEENDEDKINKYQ